MVTLRDLEAYNKLIEQVSEIDEEAAEYLRGLLDKNLDADAFSPDGCLAACIIFRDTPQGSEYWWDIQEKLDV